MLVSRSVSKRESVHYQSFLKVPLYLSSDPRHLGNPKNWIADLFIPSPTSQYSGVLFKPYLSVFNHYLDLVRRDD